MVSCKRELPRTPGGLSRAETLCAEVAAQGCLEAWVVQVEGVLHIVPGGVREPVCGPEGPGLSYLAAGHGVPRGASEVVCPVIIRDCARGKGLERGFTHWFGSVQNPISLSGEFCTLLGGLGLGTRNQKADSVDVRAGLFTMPTHRCAEAWGVPGQFRMAVVFLSEGTVDGLARFRRHPGAGCRCPGPCARR